MLGVRTSWEGNAGSVPQHGSTMRRRHPYHLGFAYRGTKNMVMSILLCIGLCIAVEGTRRTQSLFVTGCIFTPEWNYITYLVVRWTPEQRHLSSWLSLSGTEFYLQHFHRPLGEKKKLTFSHSSLVGFGANAKEIYKKNLQEEIKKLHVFSTSSL